MPDATIRNVRLVGLALLSASHGAWAANAALAYSGGITTSIQGASDSRIDPQANVSFDFLVEVERGRGAWVAYFEGGSMPRANGVPSVLGESNGDAGTVALGEGDARVQLSEFKYAYSLSSTRVLTLGIVDTHAYMDLSITANDQNAQFLGTDLVNNPTIAFPDYTPGVVLQQTVGDTGELFAVLSSSHGIADNNSPSYARLFDVSQTEKGVFGALGARWMDSGWSMEVGGWTNTARHNALSGGATDRHDYGVYGVLGRDQGTAAFDLRLGMANPHVAKGSAFASLSYELRRPEATYGLGYGYTWLSGQATGPGLGPVRHGEVYARVPVTDQSALSLDLQRIENSGFDASGINFDRGVNILGARLDYVF